MEYSLTTNDNNYVRCTSRCSQINVDFSNAVNFPVTCQANDDGNSIYDDALICKITYRINYNEKTITIDFEATNNTDNTKESSEFLYQKLNVNLNSHSNAPNEVSRTYGCSTKNDCARDHYLNAISHLLNPGENELNTIKNKLYDADAKLGNQARRRCADSSKTGNKTTIRCRLGYCHAKIETFELNEQQTSKVQNCIHDNKLYLLSEIAHHEPQIAENEKSTLEFRCNKHVCNRNDMVSKLQDIIKQYTRWNPMKQEAKPAEQERTADGKQASSSIKQVASSSILVFTFMLMKLFV